MVGYVRAGHHTTDGCRCVWLVPLQIVSATVQHMFPAIDVATIKLAQCRRVVLLHLHKVSLPRSRSGWFSVPDHFHAITRKPG